MGHFKLKFHLFFSPSLGLLEVDSPHEEVGQDSIRKQIRLSRRLKKSSTVKYFNHFSLLCFPPKKTLTLTFGCIILISLHKQTLLFVFAVKCVAVSMRMYFFSSSLQVHLVTLYVFNVSLLWFILKIEHQNIWNWKKNAKREMRGQFGYVHPTYLVCYLLLFNINCVFYVEKLWINVY